MSGPVIRKAERRKSKLRLAILGPTGGGKSYSALMLAFGLGGKVGMIDTENGSGDLYADLGDYDIIPLQPPYTVPKYREAITAFENAGYETIIIDSLSHAWAGEGGLLDKSNQLQKGGKNSFAAWGDLTPEQNRLVEQMLRSSAHIIATVRVKMTYLLEPDERGKQVPKRVGMQPVQRDGLEYEFTIVMDVDESHNAKASKDRTRLFDGWYDRITPETGKMLRRWLESGADAVPEPPKEPKRTLREIVRDKLVGCTTVEHVVAVADIPAVRKALTDAPDDIKQELNDMLADAYARVEDNSPSDAAEPEMAE